MYQEVSRTRFGPAKDTQLVCVTAASGFRLTTSVGGTLTGRGGNFIILDAPLKRQAKAFDLLLKIFGADDGPRATATVTEEEEAILAAFLNQKAERS
jgi:hypothetical protein